MMYPFLLKERIVTILELVFAQFEAVVREAVNPFQQ